MLLVVQEYCGKDPFNEFLNRIKEEKLLMSNDVIDVQKIKEIVTDYIIDSDKIVELQKNIIYYRGSDS